VRPMVRRATAEDRMPHTPPSRHRPRKRFAQHFLEPAWAAKLVTALDPQPGDAFLEIGPGTGALTRPLAETGAPVVAIEIDRDLVAHLADQLPPNVTVVAGDFLEVDVLPILFGLLPQRPAVGQARFRHGVDLVSLDVCAKDATGRNWREPRRPPACLRVGWVQKTASRSSHSINRHSACSPSVTIPRERRRR